MNTSLLQLSLSAPAPLSLLSLLVNLFIGAVLSLLLRWHFQRFGSTLSNRAQISHVFPFVLLTTILIISVVKSSLALSLGLVGALSIVRFRTPIKEPEELAYLFMCISMGLGLGADHRSATIVAAGFILTVMALVQRYQRDQYNQNLYLSIDWNKGVEGENHLEHLNATIARLADDVELRRFDVRGKTLEAIYLVQIQNPKSVSDLIVDLQKTFPGMGVTFIDQNRMPSP